MVDSSEAQGLGVGLESELRTSAAPSDTGVDPSAYGGANVQLAWVRDKRDGSVFLVFGLIELIPTEIPIVESPRADDLRLGSGSDWTLYWQVLQVPSAVALAWYSRAVEGTWTLPREGALDPSRPRERERELLGRFQEPKWPSMVFGSGGDPILPFVSPLLACPRFHHVLCSSSEVRAQLKPAERSKLGQVLLEQWGFDIDRLDHLWQSLHLVAPNPILRHVSTRLRSDDELGDQGVTVDIVPRVGQSLESLTVRVRERRATGFRTLSTFRPLGPFNFVPVAETIAQVEIAIEHDRIGLIHEQGPYAFLRSIRTNLGLVGRHRRIKLPGRSGAKEDEYKVPVTQREQPILSGHELPPNGQTKLQRARDSLKVLAETDDFKQIWLDGDSDEAARVIRKLIARARESVRIVDGYFGSSEVLRFLPAAGLESVAIEVLSSKQGLRARTRLVEGEQFRSLAQQLQLLHDELAQASLNRQINAVEVRVMRGKVAPIHDRFLQVDRSVWLLGSSLSEFGSRGTMLLKLVNPEPVRTALDVAWKSSPTLRDLVSADASSASGDGSDE